MFDNPIFWIVAIWWLLSTFLGGKARRRRAQRARAMAQQQLAVDEEGAQAEGTLEETYIPSPPPAAELDAEPPPEEAPASVPLFQRSIMREPSLEDFLRGMGISRGPVVDEYPPEEDFVEPEEEPLPIPEPVAAVEAPAEEIHAADRGAYAIREISRRTQQSFPLLSPESLARWTPLQQIVVLKEVLDAPRALRRGIR